jgi:hypothetical protein
MSAGAKRRGRPRRLLEQLPLKRLAQIHLAAHEEVGRTMRVTLKTVGGVLEVIAPPMFAITTLGAIVAMIVSFATRGVVSDTTGTKLRYSPRDRGPSDGAL